MKAKTVWLTLPVTLAIAFTIGGPIGSAQAAAAHGGEPARPKTIRDLLWVWGNPEMAKPGQHTTATFAEASPARRAQLLGVPNVVLAGNGVPNDDQEADRQTQEVAAHPRLIWEISADGSGEGRPFVYQQRMAQVRRLVDRYPQIEGVLLDDMSTVGIDHGFKPEHIRQIRALLPDKSRAVKLCGVVYTMSLDRPGINDYVKELDVIQLWTWHARDIVDLEKNVAHCEREFPCKPIVLGLYLYDYGEGRRMPLDLLRQQCDTALKLAHEGRIQGIVFLTIKNDPEAVAWTANWIKQVAKQRIGSPPGRLGADTPATKLKIGDGRNWSFFGGPWTENAEGVIRPPDKRNQHGRAFSRAEAFGDLTTEFEFNGDYRETGTGSAGLILRATDANHFYFVYFPWGGQQLRAKHFWAAVAKVDGDGYLRNLKMEFVPGVPSETDRWYQVRVEARGSQIIVWVDGRRALSVTDDTFKRGAVGLAGYGWYAFRNVHLAGKQVPPPRWNDAARIPNHAFTVGLNSENMPSGCVAPNGDVLLAADKLLVRSRDKGRTWDAPVELPASLGPVGDYGSTMFRTSKRRLRVMVYRTQEQVKQPVPEILMAESADNGQTWSEPVPSQVATNWPEQPKNLVPYGPPVKTLDGTLLRFLLGGVKEERAKFADVRTWSATHCKAFAIHSTDAGKSWSAPIELDQPTWVGSKRGEIPGSLDLTEPTGVALGNRVMVLVRPIYSPTMWQCWSPWSGATWDAAARTTFPGYAQSLVRTHSGAILCAHRYPHYAVNVSRDDGLNWDDGTVIDYPVWAMGCLVEVEPDVVLCAYMNASRKEPLLAQLIQVTPTRLIPVPR
jgi:hypothetical protein